MRLIAHSVEQQTFNWWVDSSSLSGLTSVNEIRVSGSVENHFAPGAKLVLDISPQPGDGFFALAATETPAGVIQLEAPLIHKKFAGILPLRPVTGCCGKAMVAEYRGIMVKE